MKRRHPMQPVIVADDGVVRFKENKIVRDLLELAGKHGMDLNEICVREYDKDDYSQLMELIGYSVSGYGNLSGARKVHVRRADEIAASII